MKKVPEADIEIIDNIVNQVFDNINLQVQTDRNEESQSFSIQITKTDIKEQTGRKVLRDSVVVGYANTLQAKLRNAEVSTNESGIIVSVPAYGEIKKPLTLNNLAIKNKELERELHDMENED